MFLVSLRIAPFFHCNNNCSQFPKGLRPSSTRNIKYCQFPKGIAPFFKNMGSDSGFVTFVHGGRHLFQAGTHVRPPTMRVGTVWRVCLNGISYYNNRLFYDLLLVFAIVVLSWELCPSNNGQHSNSVMEILNSVMEIPMVMHSKW